MNITINDVAITDQKLLEIWGLVREFSNDENYELEPFNEDFYNTNVLIERNLQARITPRITIIEGSGSRILDLEFHFEDGSDNATVILSGCHFSIKGLEYPRDIVKALKIPLPQEDAKIPAFLMDVFGKTIISKTEIDGVFGNGTFDTIANSNVGSLSVFSDYIIVDDIINERDEKRLEEILNEIDTPRRVFRAYAKRRNETTNNLSKKEKGFFKNINSHYTKLIEKEGRLAARTEHPIKLTSFAAGLLLLSFLGAYFLLAGSTTFGERVLNSLYFSLTVSVLISAAITYSPIKSDLIIIEHRFEFSSITIILWSVSYFLLQIYSYATMKEMFEKVEFFIIVLSILGGSTWFSVIRPNDYRYLRKTSFTIKITPAASVVLLKVGSDIGIGTNGASSIILSLPWSQPAIWVVISVLLLFVKKPFWKYKNYTYSEMYLMLEKLFEAFNKSMDRKICFEAKPKSEEEPEREDLLLTLGKRKLSGRLWGLMTMQKGAGWKVRIANTCKLETLQDEVYVIKPDRLSYFS